MGWDALAKSIEKTILLYCWAVARVRGEKEKEKYPCMTAERTYNRAGS